MIFCKFCSKYANASGFGKARKRKATTLSRIIATLPLVLNLRGFQFLPQPFENFPGPSLCAPAFPSESLNNSPTCTKVVLGSFGVPTTYGNLRWWQAAPWDGPGWAGCPGCPGCSINGKSDWTPRWGLSSYPQTLVVDGVTPCDSKVPVELPCWRELRWHRFESQCARLQCWGNQWVEVVSRQMIMIAA